MTSTSDAEGSDLAARFLALHLPGRPLLLPNPWDLGSARILASLGFAALATTSSGFAATLGRPDGAVTRDQAIGHAGLIARTIPLPVSADLENGYSDDPHEVASTVTAAIEAGLAGCSIEDSTGRQDAPIYDSSLAVERVAAAAEAAHSGPRRLVLTARAENHLHGRDDLADTIARLQRYAEVGADVLYAPGLIRASDIREVVRSVGRPVNVLALADAPPTEIRATPSSASSATVGASASASTLTGRPTEPTTSPMSLARVSPGAYSTSAPASA